MSYLPITANFYSRENDSIFIKFVEFVLDNELTVNMFFNNVAFSIDAEEGTIYFSKSGEKINYIDLLENAKNNKERSIGIYSIILIK